MKIHSEAVDILELKGYDYDLTDSWQAYRYDEVTRKIGDCCGRVYAKSIRLLIISLKEKTIKKPTYPTGDNITKEKKAICSKEYDQYIKKADLNEDQKAKGFVLILGECSTAMKNRIEKLGDYEELEKNHDVIRPLPAIKKEVFHANENKYESPRSVLAWQGLLWCKQSKEEDLIDCRAFCWIS